MQHNGKALTIRYSAEAKKLTREKYYFPHKQQQWLAMFPSFPRMTWSGRQTDWAHTEAESWRVEHKTTMLDTTTNHEVWRGEEGGTQRLFRKMSSTGKVVDLFQMEWNGKVSKLLKQGTRTWLLQNYLEAVGGWVGVRNGSSALWENSEQRSQVVALLVHSCAAGQDWNVCTVQGWHSYNSGAGSPVVEINGQWAVTFFL